MPPLMLPAALLGSAAAAALCFGLAWKMVRLRRQGEAQSAHFEARALLYKGAAERAQREAQSCRAALEALPQALAIFDSGLKLVYCNAAYASLWELEFPWLKTQPSLGELLNRLREERRLPEQRNFSAWKRRWIETSAGEASEQAWHLPSGKSIRLLVRPRPEGGFLHFCEDISQQLRLESALNLFGRVQRAMLDTLDQAVAMFGTDGRLMLHNGRFAGMWRLADSELSGEPHLRDLAALARLRIGQDGIWALIARAVNAAEGCGEWERLTRADGRVMSLVLSRLPNGATLASFTDITDLEKFRLLQCESPLPAIA